MGIKEVAKKAKEFITGKNITQGRLYDYSTKESREACIPYFVDYSKEQKSPYAKKMVVMDDYYNNKHVTQLEIQKAMEDRNVPFIPAIIPDPFIHVESQIIPDIPEFEFNGRDDDLDSQKAKQREYVVKYVVENNKVEAMNPDNERRVNKLGNAFWKVSYDYSKSGPGYKGDIVVGNPDPASMFNDPSAVEIDECEYLIYSYRMHRMKAARVFKKDLERLEMSVYDLETNGDYSDTEIYNSQTHDINDDTLQIVEFWFRQPMDGKETYEYEIEGKTVKKEVVWEAGDIACSIMISDREIRYIPKYWDKTASQNKMYPFVKYCKIPVNKSFWDKSEIEPIKDLVDAADREFATAILNDTFHANDIILQEENALADDSELDNIPGAVWKVKTGKMGSVARLGGLSDRNGGLKETIDFIREIIKQTVGNFDVNMGDAPPSNVKTLGGLVELKEQGNRRQNIKKADRTGGFERLYELIDWTALEFYDDDRMIFLGAKDDKVKKKFNEYRQTLPPGSQIQNLDPNSGPIIFKFNSDNQKITKGKDSYYPRVDAIVRAGDGIKNSKAMTLMATEKLAQMKITPENYKIVLGMLDILDIPNRKEIEDSLERLFSQVQQGQPQGQQITPDDLLAGLDEDERAYLEEHPEVLDQMMGGGQA